MSKSGQARVLSPEQFSHVLDVIKEHRYPEKNTAIMQISFKLALRVQEISLLKVKEIAKLDPVSRVRGVTRGFTLHEIMALPAAYTKGADAMGRSGTKYQRNSVTFSVTEFDRIVKNVEKLAKSGADVIPEDYYPPIKNYKGKSRDLPLVDNELRKALTKYLELRLVENPKLKSTDFLFISQKGVPYSPNSLQRHMSMILQSWALIEKATSHSGRRTAITDIVHKQKKPLKTAQKIAGHKSAATTAIYEEPTEEEIEDALDQLGR